MTDIEQRRDTLQETMRFLGAMAAGIEDTVGRPSNAMAYVAGKRLGKQFTRGVRTTTDLLGALDRVHDVLAANDCHWRFEPFKPSTQGDLVTTTPDGDQQLLLVFRDCMIRQALFCYGHEQKGSLCTMMYGFFSGALEHILGRRSKLEIVHAGENACLKRLTIAR